MAINNRFMDESRIIKEDQPIKTTQVQSESVAETPNINHDVKVVEEYHTFMQKVIENTPESNQNISPLLDTVQQESKTELEPDNKMPVYNFSKNRKTGEIKIEAIKSKNSRDVNEIDRIPIPTSDSDNKKRQIKIMIEKTKIDIIRLGIEIEVLNDIIKDHLDPKCNIYENRLRTFSEELQYNIQRKSILEKIYSDLF